MGGGPSEEMNRGRDEKCFPPRPRAPQRPMSGQACFPAQAIALPGHNRGSFSFQPTQITALLRGGSEPG